MIEIEEMWESGVVAHLTLPKKDEKEQWEQLYAQMMGWA